MYHPTSRVLAVLELLRTHNRMTGSEMAQRLEINVRTLRRYITMLQDIGVPIFAERGRYGAYILWDKHHLPPMMFTNDEVLALQVGLLAVDRLGLTRQSFAIESARAKLEQVMPQELKAQSSAVSKTVHMGVETCASPPSTQAMFLISNAAQLRRKVYLGYQSGEAEMTERDFDPYGIAYRQGRWYVAGWCHLRQALRIFRMDRISEVSLSSAEFQRPGNFDTLLYVDQSIARLPRTSVFLILLKTDMANAQYHTSHISRVLEPCSDGVMMSGSVGDLSWLARMLAGLPFEFSIFEPADLRRILRDHAARLARLTD